FSSPSNAHLILDFWKFSLASMLLRLLSMLCGGRWPNVLENMIAKGQVFNDVVAIKFVSMVHTTAYAIDDADGTSVNCVFNEISL
nr:hypothetical protein [Tanacetum cinerariifolium]